MLKEAPIMGPPPHRSRKVVNFSLTLDLGFKESSSPSSSSPSSEEECASSSDNPLQKVTEKPPLDGYPFSLSGDDLIPTTPGGKPQVSLSEVSRELRIIA